MPHTLCYGPYKLSALPMNPEVWEFSEEMLFSALFILALGSLGLVPGSFGFRLNAVTVVAHQTWGLTSVHLSARGASFAWMSANSKERANSGRGRWLVRVQGAD